MGNYYFTDFNDVETKVEFTFGYFKNKEGNLLIDLHHSSFPYMKQLILLDLIKIHLYCFSVKT